MKSLIKNHERLAPSQDLNNSDYKNYIAREVEQSHTIFSKRRGATLINALLLALGDIDRALAKK